MYNCTECHFCRTPKDKLQFSAKCCINKCRRVYCLDCIRNQYDPDFQISQYKKDTYICYFCQGKCQKDCQGCMKDHVNSAERKANRKKNKSQSKVNEESIQMSNMSGSKPLQEMHPQKLQEQESQCDFINDYRTIHEQQLIPNEEIILMPFFMQRLARRKNMYFQFMNNRDQNQNNQKDRIQGLLEGALNSGKYNTEQLDQFDEFEEVSD